MDKEQKDPVKTGSKKRKGLKRVLVATLAVLLALLLLLLLAFWLFTSCRVGLFRVDNPYSLEAEPIAAQDLTRVVDGRQYRYNTDVVNLLLLGVDAGDSESLRVTGNQADTIILVSFNLKTGAVDMLPIPRDIVSPVMVLDVSGNVAYTLSDAICTAHAYGDGGVQSGQLMEAAVSYLMDSIPVHRFASIQFEAIAPLTDYVGGVPVEMLPDFAFAAGYELSEAQTGDILLLDGEMAVQYVRERSLPYMDGTNLSRMVRQRQYLFALVDVIKARTKSDLFFPLRLYSEMQPYLKTDLTFRELAYLGWRALRAEDIQLHVMDGEMVELEYVVNQEFLQQYILDTFYVLA